MGSNKLEDTQARIADVPYRRREGHRKHPARRSWTDTCSPNLGRSGRPASVVTQVIYHHYRDDRARRTRCDGGVQVARAQKTTARKAANRRNRFIHITGGSRTVNRPAGGQDPAIQFAGEPNYVIVSMRNLLKGDVGTTTITKATKFRGLWSCQGRSADDVGWQEVGTSGSRGQPITIVPDTGGPVAYSVCHDHHHPCRHRRRGGLCPGHLAN